MGKRGALLLLTGALAGCAGEPERPTGTGAEEVVRGYYEALVRKDWRGAYAALTFESRKQVRMEQFTEWARAYRRHLRFEPQQVAVRACEEHGPEAIAHVVLSGHAGARRRFYKDAITLRRGAERWGVVLPRR